MPVQQQTLLCNYLYCLPRVTGTSVASIPTGYTRLDNNMGWKHFLSCFTFCLISRTSFLRCVHYLLIQPTSLKFNVSERRQSKSKAKQVKAKKKKSYPQPTIAYSVCPL